MSPAKYLNQQDNFTLGTPALGPAESPTPIEKGHS
jgi:hypothetical protein